MQFQSKGTSLKAKTRRLIIFFSAVILLIVLAVIFGGNWFSAILGIPSPVRTPTRDIITSTEFELLTTSTSGTLAASIPIDQIQVTSTPTMIILTPTSTHTPQKPPLALETPIGSELEIVIHRVVEGESLLLFANWYQTSTDVIQAVNLNLTYPIKSGDLVIIPVGVIDAANLPPFEPYEVTADSISVKVLAEQLNVPLVDLCFYNNIDENLILNAGDWLVIPRPSTSP